MKIGEKKKLDIEPVDGYWEYEETKFQIVSKAELKQFEDAGIKLEAGTILPTQFGQFKIISTTSDSVKVNTNHEHLDALDMPIVSLNSKSPIEDGRQSARALSVRLGVERYFEDLSWVTLPEMSLKNGNVLEKR